MDDISLEYRKFPRIFLSKANAFSKITVEIVALARIVNVILCTKAQMQPQQQHNQFYQ